MRSLWRTWVVVISFCSNIYIYTDPYTDIHIHEPTFFRPWIQKNQAPPPLWPFATFDWFWVPLPKLLLSEVTSKGVLLPESRKTPFCTAENVGNPSSSVGCIRGKPCKARVCVHSFSSIHRAVKLTGVCLKYKDTPWKINMEPKKWRFGRGFSFSIGWCLGCMLIFSH